MLRNEVYTKPETALKCIDLVKCYAPKSSIWVDPSCGPTKVFYKQFPTKKRVSVDIKFDADVRGSFLDYAPPKKTSVVVCGNAPFGRGRSINLALEFINHAIEFSDVVGLIVGASTLRDTFLGKLNGKIVEVRSVPNESFEQPPSCRCVFVVVVGGEMECPTMNTPYPVLNPVKDTGKPNLGVIKMGAIFKPITGEHLQKEWKKAVKDRRSAGQSTMYFLRVSNPTHIKGILMKRHAEAKAVYTFMSTCACNINRNELNFWLSTPNSMESVVPRKLWRYVRIARDG